jgi:hypothetical protein
MVAMQIEMVDVAVQTLRPNQVAEIELTKSIQMTLLLTRIEDSSSL